MWQFYSMLILHFLDLDKVNCDAQIQGVNQITINGVTYKNGDANMPFFNSDTYQKWVGGNCIQVIRVSGEGIKDELEAPCSDSSPASFNMNDFTLIGDPSKHQLTVYKDKSKGRLTIIRNTGCTVRSYTTTQVGTTYTDFPMNEAVCNALRTKMINEVENKNTYWKNWQIDFDRKMGKYNNNKNPSPTPPPPQMQPFLPPPVQHINLWPNQNIPPQTPTYNMQTGNEDVVTSSVVTVRLRFLQTPGPCKQEISAVGNGVKDKFIEPCTQDGPDSINRDGIMVYGDPYKLPFCLFSEKPNTLVVVKNRVCTLKTYKTINGVTTSTRLLMSIVKCSQIKKRMSDALMSRPNNPNQQASQLPPQTIVPASPYVSQPQFYPMYPQTPQYPLYTQPMTPPVPPAPTTPVSNPLNSDGSMDSTISTTVTYRPADNRVNDYKFSKTTNNYNNDGYTTREFLITGRGINDYFKYNTQPNVLPNTVIISNIFCLREPNGELELYTDTWGELWMFQNNKCFKRTYETTNGQTKITSTPMKNIACSTVKYKLTKHLGGGQVYNLGQSPQAALRPQPITTPVQQEPFPPVQKPPLVDPTTSSTVTYRPVNTLLTRPVFNVNINNYNNDGYTRREISIVGRGVNDYLKYNAQVTDSPKPVNMNNIFALMEATGDFALFTDTWGELWVFQEDKCYRRNYETGNGQTKITSTLMEYGECVTVKGKLSSHFGSHLPQASLRPQPIMPPVPQAPAPPMQKPPLVDSTTPSTVTYLPADNRVNDRKFSKTTNNYNNDGYTTREFLIAGNGINDYFKYNTQPNVLPKIVIVTNKFGLREPNGELELFTDNWGELWVFQNNKCFKRMYETANGQTKITSTPMKDKECVRVKDKLTTFMGGGQGGQIYNVGQSPQATLRPQPITPPVQKPPAPPMQNHPLPSTVTYRPADYRMNSPTFFKTTSNYNHGSYSTHELNIVGRGINDYINYNSPEQFAGTVTMNNAFGMWDSTIDFGLFTEKWGEFWVFEKDRCFKRTYQNENGQTKILSTAIESGECSTMKTKLRNHVAFTFGSGQRNDILGGKVYNFVDGQQNVNLNNNHNMNWSNDQDKASSDFDRRKADWQRDFDRRMAMF